MHWRGTDLRHRWAVIAEHHAGSCAEPDIPQVRSDIGATIFRESAFALFPVANKGSAAHRQQPDPASEVHQGDLTGWRELVPTTNERGYYDDQTRCVGSAILLTGAAVAAAQVRSRAARLTDQLQIQYAEHSV